MSLQLDVIKRRYVVQASVALDHRHTAGGATISNGPAGDLNGRCWYVVSEVRKPWRVHRMRGVCDQHGRLWR